MFKQKTFNSLSMNKLALKISLCVLIVSLYNCSGEKRNETGVEVEKAVEAFPDSIDIAEERAPEEPIPPRISLPTPENQMSYMRSSGNWDKYEEGILPQMVEDASEYSRQILESDGKRFIVVDKAKMKLFLYDPYGRIEKSCGIACAKNYGTKHKKGDSRTTEGIFKVKEICDSKDWLFTDDDGYTSPTKGVYGPRFIRLTIPYIGIHGTGSPSSIGKRCSHGCIRVTNENILDLVTKVEPGMSVIISPGPRDMAVNKKEGYNILAVSTEPGSPKAVPRWVDDKPKTETPGTEPASDSIDQETGYSNATEQTEENPEEHNDGLPSETPAEINNQEQTATE